MNENTLSKKSYKRGLKLSAKVKLAISRLISELNWRETARGNCGTNFLFPNI